MKMTIEELEREIRVVRSEMNHIKDVAVSERQRAEEFRLTLRDQFAMAAMQMGVKITTEGGKIFQTFDAAYVYKIADAMLAERSQK